VRTQKYFLKNKKNYFGPQKVEKTTSKSCLLMAVGCQELEPAHVTKKSQN
jgi:hypothetical protein